LLSAAGEVFLATEIKTGKQIAIKKMQLNPQNMKLLATEIGIMKDSKHPNVVDFYDSYIVEDKLWVRFFFLFSFIVHSLLFGETI